MNPLQQPSSGRPLWNLAGQCLTSTSPTAHAHHPQACPWAPLGRVSPSSLSSQLNKPGSQPFFLHVLQSPTILGSLQDGVTYSNLTSYKHSSQGQGTLFLHLPFFFLILILMVLPINVILVIQAPISPSALPVLPSPKTCRL